ncbi:ASCH domain-containing protein [Caballeronia sp. LZ028]|uniref:ASCH domain-containing protein n=1 Tax=Caballeronia sp. LZ028 TaxID=3038563 RepID=UPI0028588686|nr:ASCH domain-containing protein [Caballeronia sp. LZ028]MDR5765003.1 ASCH domain-containing protein [Caballeronia sp. LZ028]
MKALSIRQPWAWLIVNGHKDIENRTWPTRFRGRVLVHASKGMTRAEYEDVSAFAEGLQLPARDDLERGGIVGVATIADCIPSERRTSIWHMEGQFGFQIANARALPFVECKGALGFFNVPDDVAALLRSMHAPAAA